MKRIVFLLNLTIGLLFTACSYKTQVINSQNLKDAGDLNEALASINEAVNPKNEDAKETLKWPKTWEVRGEIYQAIYQSDDENVKKLADAPLTEALYSYKKALELDEKGKFDNSLKVKLTVLTNEFANQAIGAFNKQDYNLAVSSFENILAIQDIDIVKQENPDYVDTVVIYNTGLAAYNAENYDKAIKYFNEAARYGYGEAKTYSMIASSYQFKTDTLAALETLKVAFKKYPTNESILQNLIQIYLDIDKTEEAMKYLELAIERDPDNANYYFAKGSLFEKLGQDDKAIATYQKAIDADNESFNAHYNLGAIYYNKGVNQIEAANKVPAGEVEKYQTELDKADEWFKTALVYMEKCQELKPNDNFTLESLKNIYYRLKYMDKYNKILEKLGQ
jgi:tetratricopeptide (TPR) repeat protein